jgi:LysM repeat protein
MMKIRKIKNKKKRRRLKLKNRRRFFSLISILLLLILIYIFTFPVFGQSSIETNINQKIIIKTGDTLWSIAREHKDKNQDIRSYIYKVKKLNNLETSIIYAGDVLALP